MGEGVVENKVTGRLPYIDSCRGFVILLVIIGHVVQCLYRPKGFDSNVLFRVIYAFHMPFFFFLSGYVSRSEICSFAELIRVIKKRTLQLMLPFCLWGVYLNLLDYEEPIYVFFLKPDHGLWFCFHLYIAIVYCYIVVYFSKILPYGGGRVSKMLMLIIGYLVLKKISEWNTNDYGQTLMLLYFYPYYAGGMILGELRHLLVKYRYSIITAVLSIVVFLVLASVWYRIPSAIPKDAPQFIHKLNSLLTYQYITAFMGILSTIMVFSRMNYTESKHLIYLGKCSLGIYAIHFVIIKTFSDAYFQLCKPFCESFVGLVTNSILLLIISMMVIGAIKKSQFIALIMIGEVNTNKN